jgi:hypothetical protein
VSIARAGSSPAFGTSIKKGVIAYGDSPFFYAGTAGAAIAVPR